MADLSDFEELDDMILEPFNPSEMDMGEVVKISGIRDSPITIKINRKSQWTPTRDAVMLEALLSTSLDTETWRAFIQIIVSRYSPEATAALAETFRNTMSHISSKPSSTKRKPRKPPTNEQQGDYDL